MPWLAVGQKAPGCVKKKMRYFLVFAFVAVLAGTGVVLARTPHSGDEAHAEDSGKELRLVHVLFRHGQRTPADTYPNDIYVNHTFEPFGWGQLTNVGRKDQYDTGVFLRKRFDSFLGDLYSADAVYAQATQSDRTQMSCALTLAGMWPPRKTGLDWNPELNWSPIPIKYQNLDEDTLLLARKNCARYFEERENAFKAPEIQKLFKDNEKLFKELTELTGMKVESPEDIQNLYSTLKAEEGVGLTLPKWTAEYYPEKLLPLTEESFILNAYNSELKRLKGGPLVKKLISDWTAKAAGTLSPKGRKIFVYAGHDSTISNLLLALGAWDKQVPGYGIMIIFELYEDVKTKEFGVEFFLRNSTTVPPYPLTIPGCTHHCPLTKLVELTKNAVPAVWSGDCKTKDPNYVAPEAGGP